VQSRTSLKTFDTPDKLWLAGQVERAPSSFLAAASEFAAHDMKSPLAEILRDGEARKIFPRVVTWTLIDCRRVTLVPASSLAAHSGRHAVSSDFEK